MTLGVAGWGHLVLFGVVVPFLAWRSRGQLAAHADTPMATHLRRVIAQLVVFLLISLAVAAAEGITLFPPYRVDMLAIGLAALLVMAGVVAMTPRWRRSVEQHELKARLFTPRTPAERRLWAGVSVAAGLAEEVTYRGVLWVLLTRLTGDVAVAAVLASVAFGAGHAVQGWGTALVVVGIALLVHGLVALEGALYTAIVAHAVYDLIAGLTHGRLGRELEARGVAPDPGDQHA